MATRAWMTGYNARKRRRTAQDQTAYQGLVASPASLGSAAAGASLDAFSVPANSRLGLSVDAALETGDLVVNIGSRQIGVPTAASGTVLALGYIEKDSQLVVERGAAGPAGTVTLHVIDEWGRPTEIASGTFS